MTTKILLIGCGKMGSAMLAGWINQGTPAENVVVIEPNADYGKTVADQYGVTVVTGEAAIPAAFTPTVIIMAVKPQVMPAVLPAYARFAKAGTTYLSIAAGKSIAFFEGLFGADAAIVRAMPNTPAAVGRGYTALFPNGNVSEDAKAECQKLLEAVGTVGWLASEDQINAVTGVSGSGPAYVFHMIEAMAAAGVAHGLSEEMSMELARTTVIGSAELARQSDESAAQLRINVTSPGGTTAAALEVLMDEERGMTPLMIEAVAANIRRSEELAD